MNELVRKDEECVSNSGIPIARNFTPAFVYSLLCTIYILIATPYLLDLEGPVILGGISFKNIFINCKDKYKILLSTLHTSCLEVTFQQT